MKNVVKTLRLETLDYYKTHLSIINCILPVKITNKEIEVLALYMYFSKSLEDDRFGTVTRKLIRERLGITHQGLSNYINSLVEKSFLIVNQNKEMSIFPLLHPNPDNQVYMLKLVNIEEFTPIVNV
jgi:DNA-binding MarR family transcriptional regulator